MWTGTSEKVLLILGKACSSTRFDRNLTCRRSQLRGRRSRRGTFSGVETEHRSHCRRRRRRTVAARCENGRRISEIELSSSLDPGATLNPETHPKNTALVLEKKKRSRAVKINVAIRSTVRKTPVSWPTWLKHLPLSANPADLQSEPRLHKANPTENRTCLRKVPPQCCPCSPITNRKLRAR